MRSLIRFGAREFDAAGLAYGHGTGDARDDAAALVFHALGLDHADAEAAYAVQARRGARSRTVLALFAERVERRVPAAYLMGRMWFAGLEFEVDERVIVPRSPFAELIARGLRAVDRSRPRVRRILDIGTGSGCIAIACAVRFPQARVDAVDLSPHALEVAARNVARHGVGRRVHLHQGDVFEPLGDAALRPDRVESAVRQRRGNGRAAAPSTGTSRTWRCARAATGSTSCGASCAAADAHLEPGGVLFVEVGDSDERLQQAFPELPFLWLEFEHGGGGVFLLRGDELATSDSGTVVSCRRGEEACRAIHSGSCSR